MGPMIDLPVAKRSAYYTYTSQSHVQGSLEGRHHCVAGNGDVKQIDSINGTPTAVQRLVHYCPSNIYMVKRCAYICIN